MSNECFHGIGENLLKFASIMKYGIVSQENSIGVTAFQKTGKRTSNADNKVSVVIPHEEETGALRTYILEGGISFIVKVSNLWGAKYEGIYDEGLTDDISLESIKGIIINTSIRRKKIRDLSVLGKCATSSVIDMAKTMMESLVLQGISTLEFEGINELFKAYSDFSNIDVYWERAEERKTTRAEIDKIISRAIQKFYCKELGKDSVSVMDVIEYYNDGRYPIYDENYVKEYCKGKKVSGRYIPSSKLYQSLEELISEAPVCEEDVLLAGKAERTEISLFTELEEENR